MDLFDIPVIQPDLRHEETIIQIANAFDLLQQVITEVRKSYTMDIKQRYMKVYLKISLRNFNMLLSLP